MDSRNRSPRNEKQEELIKRLEQIRNQRDTIQPSKRPLDDVQTTRRNQNQQTARRNETKQQSQPSQKQSGQRTRTQKNAQHSKASRQPSSYDNVPTAGVSDNKEDYMSANTISRGEIHDSIRKNDLARKNKYTDKNHSKPLINQLSSGENLAQAIILNEVLSKPIALRYNNR